MAVSLTTPTPWATTESQLGGFDIVFDEVPQSDPVVAEGHGGELFGVAYFNGSGEDLTVSMKIYDQFGEPPAEGLHGPVDVSDGSGLIQTDQGLSITGWIDGYTVAWGEKADASAPTLLKAQLVGLDGLLGGEFYVADPADYSTPVTVVEQKELSLSGGEQELPSGDLLLGFAAAWTEVVDDGGVQTSRIMLQRFELVLDATGHPAAAEPGGADGFAGTGSDEPVELGIGRDPEVLLLLTGEQVVAWVGDDGDGTESVQVSLLAPEGGPSLFAGTTVPVLDGAIANGDNVSADGTVKLVALGDGGFGIFWVANDGLGGHTVWGQTWGLPDGAVNFQALAPAHEVIALPADWDGTFSVVGLGDTTGHGVIAYGSESGGQLVQLFDDAGFATADPAGSVAADGDVAYSGGLIGGRIVSVWDDGSGNVEAQLLDARVPGQKLIGDRDRLDGSGRVDARPDAIVGTVGDDIIITDRGDTRGGDQEDDVAWGALGNDTLYGGGDEGGMDVLDGGEGDDVSAYRGAKGEYSVTINGDGTYTVLDMALIGRDGFDIVNDVETLAFGSTINTTYLADDADLQVGADQVDMGIYFSGLPGLYEGLPAGTPTDGTPIGWGTVNTDSFAVNTGLSGTTDLAAGDQGSVQAIGIFGSFGFAWQSGNDVLLKIYDPLGQPDVAGFAGGIAGTALELTDNDNPVSDLFATLAGEGGIVAVWSETDPTNVTGVRGTFVSAVSGITGHFDAPTPTAGLMQTDAKAYGYLVEGDLGLLELGFHVVYTEGSDGVSGDIVVQRYRLYNLANGDPDPAVNGEGAPVAVGNDGEVGTGDETGLVIGQGRDPAVTHLHDGELVVAWVEPDGAGGEAVRFQVMGQAENATTGFFTFDQTSFAVQTLAADIVAGSKIEVINLGFNFAVSYVDAADGHFKAQVFAPGLGAYTPQAIADFGPMPAGVVGEYHVVPSDFDGESFSLLVEATDGGVTTVTGQLFGADGAPIGSRFTAFENATSAGQGFSGGLMDDGRVVVGAAGTVPDSLDTDVVGYVYDTRAPGEQIIGPRDGTPPDLLIGTIGNDAMDGRIDDDEIHGGLGDDVLLGGAQNDTLFGEDGNDTMLGGAHDDNLQGGAGDDLAMGGFGTDVMDGGDGNDTVSYQGEFASFEINLATGLTRSTRNPNFGTPRPMAAEDTFSNFENATGGEMADTLIGDGGNNVLSGLAGDDVLSGGDGDDTLIGGDGSDTALFAGNQSEYVITTENGTTLVVSDTLAGRDGTARLVGVEFVQFFDAGPLAVADLLNPNADPEINSGDAVSVAEDQAAGVELLALSATDPDGDPVTFSIESDPSGLFEVSGTSLQLAAGNSLDFETATSHVVTIRAEDGNGGVALQDVTVTVTDVDEAPDFPAQPTANLEGEQAEGSVVLSLVATDPEGQPVTFAFAAAPDANPGGLFAISGSDVVVAPAQTLPIGSYTLQLVASDGALETPQSFTVEVAAEVNDPPVFSSADTASVDENLLAGTLVHTLAATDPEGGAVTFVLTDNGGGAFALQNGNEIVTTAPLDHEAVASYTIEVTASDPEGTVTPQSIQIDVGDVNETPTLSLGTPAPVLESAAIGAGVMNLAGTASDPDAGDVITYTLTDDAGGLFAISNNQIVVNGALDFETATSHSVTVRATDAGGLFDEGTVNITVSDVDEAPDFTIPPSATLPENTLPGTVIIANLTGTDPEGELVTFSLANDPDGFFEIDANNNVVLHEPLNFEAATFHTVTVVASAGTGPSSSQGFTLFVEDVDEPTGPGPLTLTENADTFIGTDAAEQVDGLGGNDSILGEGGNDHLWGGAGNDLLRGGLGLDTLEGGGDADSIFGDRGNDLLLGDAGNDTIRGGDGNDTMNGGTGNDRLQGDDGDDLLQFFGAFGDDVVARFGDREGDQDRLAFDAGVFTDFADLLDLSDGDGMTGNRRATVIEVGDNSVTLNRVDIASLDADDFIFG